MADPNCTVYPNTTKHKTIAILGMFRQCRRTQSFPESSKSTSVVPSNTDAVETSSFICGNMDTFSLIARVDEEIARQKSLLTNLLAYRNSLTFISRLPTETMQTIFIHCARDSHGLPNRRHAVPSWVNVSYVCHHWRDIAPNCPALWSYHFVVSPRWMEGILARSMQASLKIYLDKSDDTWPLDLLEKVLNHAERIQDLHLGIPDMSFDEILSKLSLHVPCLQSLVISAGF